MLCLGLATEWIEIICPSGGMRRKKGLGLATEWIEIEGNNTDCDTGDRLGLATEWIEMFLGRYNSMRYLSRSCDRVD